MDPIFYTVVSINGDYANLITDDGQSHSITMFLLPEGTSVGTRLKLENFMWEIVDHQILQQILYLGRGSPPRYLRYV